MKILEFFFDLKGISDYDSQILIAQLFDLGFDSFEESENHIKTYIFKKKATKVLLKRLKKHLIVKNINFSFSELENKNWNHIWESNFSPVYFKSGIIRAPFHMKDNSVKYDVIINPKMSFGTGHHETTKMMINAMLSLNSNPNNVLDFGCGTAILSILSEKIWKSYVLALDINEWAYKNSIENLKLNFSKNILVKQYSIDKVSKKKAFDLILANISTNVLVKNMFKMTNLLKKGGVLILSGFYTSDLPKINKKACSFGLSLINKFENNEWQCIICQNLK